MSFQPHHAIILGELAESRKLKQEHLGKIPDHIRNSCAEVNKKQEASNQIRYEIIRMDHFIAMIDDPVSALKSLVMLASHFRFSTYRDIGVRTELKLALALGDVEFLQQALRESDGAAIRLAALSLEEMKRNQRLVIKSVDPSVNEELEVACSFMDILLHDWSDEQAEAVFLSLTGMNQMQISEALKISQPAVNRRLKAAHLEAISKFLKRFETLAG